MCINCVFILLNFFTLERTAIYFVSHWRWVYEISVEDLFSKLMKFRSNQRGQWQTHDYPSFVLLSTHATDIKLSKGTFLSVLSLNFPSAYWIKMRSSYYNTIIYVCKQKHDAIMSQYPLRTFFLYFQMNLCMASL